MDSEGKEIDKKITNTTNSTILSKKDFKNEIKNSNTMHQDVLKNHRIQNNKYKEREFFYQGRIEESEYDLLFPDVTIELSNGEKELFESIKRFIKENNRKTIARVAGGWVRDKILGKACCDIDIVLDNISGYNFAKDFIDYCSLKTSSIGVVKSNPDKSKHIESAVVRINDLVVDFLQLRTEEYSNDSRIPSVEIGNPHEDAFRRDLTINSMFYNINTGKVEDFTRMGFVDLKKKFLRTPIEPVQTFLDDPLRILRILRFASILNFELDPLIYEAIQKEEVQTTLKNKVSHERIGIELYKMMKGSFPEIGMRVIAKYGLYDAIFKPDVRKVNYYSTTDSFLKEVDQYKEKRFDWGILSLYSILHIYCGEKVKIEGNKKVVYQNYKIAKEKLKYMNKFNRRIETIEKGIEYLKNINLNVIDRLLLLRFILICKEEWKNSLFIFIIISKINRKDDLVIKLFNIYDSIFTEDLELSYTIHPIITGNYLNENFIIKKELYYKILNECYEVQITEKLTDPCIIIERIVMNRLEFSDIFKNA